MVTDGISKVAGTEKFASALIIFKENTGVRWK